MSPVLPVTGCPQKGSCRNGQSLNRTRLLPAHLYTEVHGVHELQTNCTQYQPRHPLPGWTRSLMGVEESVALLAARTRSHEPSLSPAAVSRSSQ